MFFSGCSVQPFRLTTAAKLTTAFWKLHLKGAVQFELPLLFILGGDRDIGDPNLLDSKSNHLINSHSDLYTCIQQKDLKDAGNDHSTD